VKVGQTVAEISQFFVSNLVTSAIWDFQKFEIFSFHLLYGANGHYLAKFRRNWSKSCGDIAV